jgi:outer membrane receptor protein involved in Fe transport
MNRNHVQQFFLLLSALIGFSVALSAQTVTGRIIDNRSGEGLVGVTISIKNTVSGTISDSNGNYSISAKDGDILVFHYVGMLTKEAIVSSSQLDVSMKEDNTTFFDLITSTTRLPVRKIQATSAVSVISPKVLETLRPEGISEAIQGTPGVYTSQSQGRNRGTIFMRGFPDGSGDGLVYTGILIDGLPSLATSARPPDFTFGIDANVERIEVVRGNTATRFGRAAAAGVVNVISKVGGERLGGMLRVTNYNENVDTRDGFDYKAEFNLNGPISDKLRYNVGGFYVDDRGFRDLGYNDEGGQFRANIDYLGEKGSVRLFGGFTHMTIQNMSDIPYRLSDNTPREGWSIYNSFYAPIYDTYNSPINQAAGIPDGNIQVTDRDGNTQNRSLRAANEEGHYTEGYHLGLFVDYELAPNFRLSNKLRYQNYDYGTKSNLGVSAFYFDDPNDPIGLLNLRTLIDGDGNDTDIIDELRLTYDLEGSKTDHSISLGTYYSSGSYKPEIYSWFHAANATANDRRLGLIGPLLNPDGIPILLPDGTTIPVITTVGAHPDPFGDVERRDEYTVTVNAFFLSDEIRFGDNLTINAGIRWDKIGMDIAGFYNNPKEAVSAENPADINRQEDHSDVSFSLGANYLTNPHTAVYGNFVRAFRMPDYSAYTPAYPSSLNEHPKITDNETIWNAEVGYRTGIRSVGIELAAFYSLIENRLATTYEGTSAVIKPLGSNQIAGGEIGLTYAPSIVKGLLLRSSFTYQHATFQDFVIPFSEANPNGNLYGLSINQEGTDASGNTVYSIDLKGNQIPRIPSTLFNLMANYDAKFFGANAALNYFGNRYADATNLYQLDDMTNLNVGVYAKFPVGNSQIRLNFLVKNVLNTDKALRFLYVADDDAALARQQLIDTNTGFTAANTFYSGIPFLPRRFLTSISYEF